MRYGLLPLENNESIFFICDDDTLYGFLASLHTNNIYIKNAIFIKKIKRNGKKLSNLQLYYLIRNYRLKTKTLSKMGFQNKFNYFFLTHLSSFFSYTFFIAPHAY